MSDDSEDSLDRRNFMVAAIGASATLAVNTGAANAQDTSASSAGSAPAAPRGTLYTGDAIQGKRSSARSMSTTSNLARSTFSISRGCKCLRGSIGMCQ